MSQPIVALAQWRSDRKGLGLWVLALPGPWRLALSLRLESLWPLDERRFRQALAIMLLRRA